MNWEVNPRDIFINKQQIWIPNAAYTDDEASAEQFNDHHKGVTVVTEVLIAPGVHTIQTTVSYIKPVSLTKEILATGALITAAGTYVMQIYPGIAVVADEAFSDVLPKNWTVEVSHGTPGQSFTYSVGGYLML